MAICKTEVSGGGDGTGKYESNTCSYLCLRFSLIMQYFCFYVVLWKFSFLKNFQFFWVFFDQKQTKARNYVAEMAIFVTKMAIL